MIVHSCAVGQIPERLRPRLAGAQLEVDQPQFVGEIRMREPELLADPLNRLVQAESGFDADDEQVERVRQPQADPMLALLGHPAERHAGQQVAERAARPAPIGRFGRIKIDDTITRTP